jgi:hypothetical protein
MFIVATFIRSPQYAEESTKRKPKTTTEQTWFFLCKSGVRQWASQYVCIVQSRMCVCVCAHIFGIRLCPYYFGVWRARFLSLRRYVKEYRALLDWWSVCENLGVFGEELLQFCTIISKRTALRLNSHPRSEKPADQARSKTECSSMYYRAASELIHRQRLCSEPLHRWARAANVCKVIWNACKPPTWRKKTYKVGGRKKEKEKEIRREREQTK